MPALEHMAVVLQGAQDALCEAAASVCARDAAFAADRAAVDKCLGQLTTMRGLSESEVPVELLNDAPPDAPAHYVARARLLVQQAWSFYVGEVRTPNRAALPERDIFTVGDYCRYWMAGGTDHLS